MTKKKPLAYKFFLAKNGTREGNVDRIVFVRNEILPMNALIQYSMAHSPRKTV